MTSTRAHWAESPGTWLERPASDLLFLLVALLVIVYALLVDRTFLIDQQNYIQDFARPTSWELDFDSGGFFQRLVVELFSEEILWRVWTTVIGAVLSAPAAVLLTSLVLNSLVAASAWRVGWPTLALLLWVLLPVGFAVTGLQQLRQGFAFAILLFFSLRLRRPVLGTLVAGTLHTTFAVAFVFALIGWMLRTRSRLAIAAAVTVAYAGALAGRILFDAFGGRRLLVYSLQEGATSLNYVLAGLLCILPSLYWLATQENGKEQPQENEVISRLALIHVGATMFTVFSTFLFPIGAGRLGYLSQLMLIPVLPAVLERRRGALPGAISALIVLYVLYLTGKAYLDGTYSVYLGV